MSDLHRQMEAVYKRKVEGHLEKTVRLIAFSVFTELVGLTPVGNPSLWAHPAPTGYVGGTARLSWNMDVNVVDVKITEATAEVGQNFNGAEKALSAVAKYKLKDTIYIANALPYIRPLNDGHSTQAPAGFIDAGIQVGVRKGKELAGKA